METTMERKSRFSTWEPLGSWLKGLLRTLHSLGIWNEKLAMAVAVATDYPGSYQVTAEVAGAVTVDELAAPVPTEVLTARSRDLQARIDAARTLLKAREL
jgi:hypothetical protein